MPTAPASPRQLREVFVERGWAASPFPVVGSVGQAGQGGSEL